MTGVIIFFAIVAVVLAILIISAGIKVVPQSETRVIERLGRFHVCFRPVSTSHPICGSSQDNIPPQGRASCHRPLYGTHRGHHSDRPPRTGLRLPLAAGDHPRQCQHRDQPSSIFRSPIRRRPSMRSDNLPNAIENSPRHQLKRDRRART